MKTFLVDIDLPQNLTPEFMQLIPMQRKFISRMMKEGVVNSYSLSDKRDKLWVVIKADTLFDVKNIVGSFPIFNFIRFTIHSLLYHETSYLSTPQLWLN